MGPLKIQILGDPRTKKNSSQIFRRGSKPFVSPSDAFKAYEAQALLQLPFVKIGISEPVNVRCVYYMATHRRVDLINLLGATMDILVKAGVLADDNANIVASHDGSRVRYDKRNPRVEIVIEEVRDADPEL